MPIILLLTLINIVLLVHAAKTGRFSPWGYIILMIPGIGAIAYVVAELIPAWFGTLRGQQARKSVSRAGPRQAVPRPQGRDRTRRHHRQP
jgi:hypothetical protein